MNQMKKIAVIYHRRLTKMVTSGVSFSWRCGASR